MFEGLEQRRLLSVTVSDAGAVEIQGTMNSDTIVIGLQSDNSKLDVSVNGQVTTVEVAAINTVTVYGSFGKDHISVDETNGALPGGVTMYGGPGKDTLIGGAGDDSIYGWNGNDSLVGGGGNDLLDAYNGADELVGGEGDDTLLGGNGPDRLDGGAGADSLAGGRGRDYLAYDDSDTLDDTPRDVSRANLIVELPEIL